MIARWRANNRHAELCWPARRCRRRKRSTYPRLFARSRAPPNWKYHSLSPPRGSAISGWFSAGIAAECAFPPRSRRGSGRSKELAFLIAIYLPTHFALSRVQSSSRMRRCLALPETIAAPDRRYHRENFMIFSPLSLFRSAIKECRRREARSPRRLVTRVAPLPSSLEFSYPNSTRHRADISGKYEGAGRGSKLPTWARVNVWGK